jgi:hypothetical protein
MTVVIVDEEVMGENDTSHDQNKVVGQLTTVLMNIDQCVPKKRRGKICIKITRDVENKHSI